MLGNPDASSLFAFGSDQQFSVNHTDAYSLGYIGKAKDISTLELHYSRDGRLVSAKIIKR